MFFSCSLIQNRGWQGFTRALLELHAAKILITPRNLQLNNHSFFSLGSRFSSLPFEIERKHTRARTLWCASMRSVSNAHGLLWVFVCVRWPPHRSKIQYFQTEFFRRAHTEQTKIFITERHRALESQRKKKFTADFYLWLCGTGSVVLLMKQRQRHGRFGLKRSDWNTYTHTETETESVNANAVA